MQHGSDEFCHIYSIPVDCGLGALNNKFAGYTVEYVYLHREGSRTWQTQHQHSNWSSFPIPVSCLKVGYERHRSVFRCFYHQMNTGSAIRNRSDLPIRPGYCRYLAVRKKLSVLGCQIQWISLMKSSSLKRQEAPNDQNVPQRASL